MPEVWACANRAGKADKNRLPELRSYLYFALVWSRGDRRENYAYARKCSIDRPAKGTE
ncbi:unnamed protein product, partial [marine sediment metagenome]